MTDAHYFGECVAGLPGAAVRKQHPGVPGRAHPACDHRRHGALHRSLRGCIELVCDVFGKGWWVPALAALWGAAIFNIDRLIVMTMHGDFVRKLIAAIPRLILATVIAVVITRPLELWIFAPEIKRAVTLAEQETHKRNDAALEAEVKTAQARYRAAVATAGLATGVTTSKTALDEALAEVSKCRSALQTRENEYRLEMNGTADRYASATARSRKNFKSWLRDG